MRFFLKFSQILLKLPGLVSINVSNFITGKKKMLRRKKRLIIKNTNKGLRIFTEIKNKVCNSYPRMTRVGSPEHVKVG